METGNINTLINQIEELKQVKNNLQTEIIQLDDEILFQEFGVYKPLYSFAKVDEYKHALENLREEQKSLIKAGNAAFCRIEWKVNGSEKEGKKLIAENIKQIIRNFNAECDICIDKTKFSNIDKMRDRIIKSFEFYNQINETHSIEISQEYLQLKLDELSLAYEYQVKKQEEKEELRQLREQRKEEERVAKEIEAKRIELEKEQTHYLNQLKRIEEQIADTNSEEKINFLLEKKAEYNDLVDDVAKAMSDLDYREANFKAGYVYIISNIGAFGENIYKIGMTRRLDPEDRISELSGAAVPFRYDVHALIFSNDAPKLEAALHNAFEDKKVNLVNGRKEFFRVDLDEIKKVVQENHDKTVEFKNIPDAEQYRESEMIRRNRLNNTK